MSLPKPYYEHAGQTIYLGDCRELLPHLPKVDLVLTDPPYGNASIMKGGAKKKGGGGAFFTTSSSKDGFTWDTERPQDLVDMAIKLGQFAIVWGGNYYHLPPSRCWIVWNKPDALPTFADCELAWCSKQANAKVIHASINETNKERCGHPTQKPLKVMTGCLEMFPEAQTVLDPFMGSGTTLVACKQLGRKGIGIEIDERYAAIAAERLSQEVFPFFDEPNDQENGGNHVLF